MYVGPQHVHSVCCCCTTTWLVAMASTGSNGFAVAQTGAWPQQSSVCAPICLRAIEYQRHFNFGTTACHSEKKQITLGRQQIYKSQRFEQRQHRSFESFLMLLAGLTWHWTQSSAKSTQISLVLLKNVVPLLQCFLRDHLLRVLLRACRRAFDSGMSNSHRTFKESNVCQIAAHRFIRNRQVLNDASLIEHSFGILAVCIFGWGEVRHGCCAALFTYISWRIAALQSTTLDVFVGLNCLFAAG